MENIRPKMTDHTQLQDAAKPISTIVCILKASQKRLQKFAACFLIRAQL